MLYPALARSVSRFLPMFSSTSFITRQSKLPSEEDLVIPDPEAELVAALHAIPDWTIPYLDYLTRGVLPDDELTAHLIV